MSVDKMATCKGAIRLSLPCRALRIRVLDPALRAGLWNFLAFGAQADLNLTRMPEGAASPSALIREHKSLLTGYRIIAIVFTEL